MSSASANALTSDWRAFKTSLKSNQLIGQKFSKELFYVFFYVEYFYLTIFFICQILNTQKI